MSDNTFGTNFKVTTFGESHGPAIGAVVDGMPANVVVDCEFIQKELDRRRPGCISTFYVDTYARSIITQYTSKP